MTPKDNRPAHAVDPQQFRAQGTGVGHTRSVSLVTGNMRAQKIVDTTAPQRSTVGKAPPHAGFPDPTPAAQPYGPAVRGKGRPY